MFYFNYQVRLQQHTYQDRPFHGPLQFYRARLSLQLQASAVLLDQTTVMLTEGLFVDVSEESLWHSSCSRGTFRVRNLFINLEVY